MWNGIWKSWMKWIVECDIEISCLWNINCRTSYRFHSPLRLARLREPKFTWAILALLLLISSWTGNPSQIGQISRIFSNLFTESNFERNAPSLDQNPAFHAHIVLCGLNVVLKRFRFVWVVLKRFQLVWVVFWQIQWLDNKLPWISQFELSWALWDGCWSLRFSVVYCMDSMLSNQISLIAPIRQILWS